MKRKPEVINTVFIDLTITIEECEEIIKAFEERGYTAIYNAKAKVINTTAPKSTIAKLSKIFKGIQSYNLIDRNPNNEKHFSPSL